VYAGIREEQEIATRRPRCDTEGVLGECPRQRAAANAADHARHRDRSRRLEARSGDRDRGRAHRPGGDDSGRVDDGDLWLNVSPEGPTATARSDVEFCGVIGSRTKIVSAVRTVCPG
jgi:hypothetical protein